MAMHFGCLGELEEEKDLIVFDIPQLTVYRNSISSKRYLALVEDDDGNEFLFAEVDKDGLIGLLECRTPLRSLLVNNKFAYLVNWSKEDKNWCVERVLSEDLDDSMLPVADECFESISDSLQNYLLELEGFSEIIMNLANYISYGQKKTYKRLWLSGHSRTRKWMNKSNAKQMVVEKIVNYAYAM